VLLFDDYAGRQAAKRLDVAVMGLVGLLLLAKENGLLDEVRPLMEELRTSGYWLSDKIVEIARQLAGE
jgi:uncharacterized protein